MSDDVQIDLAYFPGCSLATSASESNVSLLQSARILGFNLIELADWNCCGSSSAQIFGQDLSLGLPARNLSLVPEGRPLAVMCPRCLYSLRRTQSYLRKEPATCRAWEEHWGRVINLDIDIMHFLEVLVRYGLARLRQKARRNLKGLKFFPYYGCTVFRPASMAQEKYYEGELENILVSLGAQPITAAYSYRCCGSFLTATEPDLVNPLVDEIFASAVGAGANCLVTACAMCQLNLEIRGTAKMKIPVFHFSEILALALGAEDYEKWFRRHLVDPRPLVQELLIGESEI
jgi:heterodisulfide reductase subunit B2